MMVVGQDNVLSVASGMHCLTMVPGPPEASLEINILSRPDRRDKSIRRESIWDRLPWSDDHTAFYNLHVASHAHITVDRSVFGTALPMSEVARSMNASERAPVALRLIDEFVDCPTRMVASNHKTATRLVYSFAEGMRAVWPERRQSCALANDFFNPITAFSNNGILAVACQATSQLAFYRLQDSQAQQLAHADGTGGRPGQRIRFLTCGLAGNQILAFYADGHVEQFEISVR